VMSRILPPALAAFFLLAPALLASEKVALRHKFTKAEKNLLQDSLETYVGFNIPGRDAIEFIIKAGRKWEQTVKSLKGKTVQTGGHSAKIKAVKFNMVVPERGSVDFDSESPTARQEARLDPVAAGLYKLKGRKFSFVVDGLGKVGKTGGLAGVVKGLFGRVKAKEVITQSAARVCIHVFGDEGTAEAVKEYYIPFPKGESAPKDRWKGEMINSIHPIGKAVTAVEYTLGKIEEGKAHIALSGRVEKIDTRTASLELPAKDDPTFGMFRQLLESLVIESSTVSGEVVFDVEKGRVLKATNTVDMKLKTEFNLMGRDMTIPFSAKKSRTVEWIEPEEKEKGKK
jgi:hypothetical protein